MNASLRLALAPILIATVLAFASATARTAEAPAPGLTPPALRLPTPVTRTLANGLRVEVFPTTRSPLVVIQLMVPAGSAQEPDRLSGLAALTAELLRHGTASRSAEAFGLALSSAGATFNTWAGRDFALVAASGRSSTLEPMIELMSDAVRNPLLAGEQFPTAVDAWVRRLMVQRQGLAELADQQVAEAAFTPHPYSHSAGSYLAALAQVKQSDVMAFHRDYWRPDRAVLSIGGDIAPERAFALAEDWFSGWQGRTVPDAPRPSPRPLEGVRIVDVPRTPRSEIRVAVPGPGIAQPGFASWSLAQSAIESSSLPSGVRASLVPARDASLIVLSSSVPNDQVAAQAGRMTESLRSFASSPPSGSALEAIRHRVRQRYPLGLETLGAFLAQWQANAFSGLAADEVARAGERIAAADLSPSLPRLAAKPVVVVVGSAETLRASLASLGPVSVEPAERPRPAPPDTMDSPSAEQVGRGAAALASALKAHGGAAAFKSVRTLAFEGEIVVFRGGQELPARFSHVHVDPDKFSAANQVFTYESRQVMVGDRGWTLMKADSSMSAPLDSAGVAGLRAVFHSDLVHVLRAASAAGTRAALRGHDIVSGRECDLVDFKGPVGWQRIAIDVVSHRVLAIDGGLDAELVWHERRVLSDFRPVNGLVLPYAEEHLLDGTRDSNTIVRQIGVNRELDMTLFDPPSSLSR